MPHAPQTESAGHPVHVPAPADVEVIGLIPLLAPYFRKGLVEGAMPEPLLGTMKAHHLTPRHGAVLPQLLAGELTVGELARRLRVSLPTASELVGALNRAGIVEREEDPANRRRVLVSLSPDYRPAIERFIATRSEPLLRALDTLSPRDRAGFVAGLAAWTREVLA
ncbi:MarR family winged helix-turn-helix transcriptional regulator [Streptomyces rimosus]|uniref:MarR family winged helix-turn-helix transcriptional regulator n=1 Tax=Streptomyces rimosus TaxID=1927 RepID=UPI00379E6E0B